MQPQFGLVELPRSVESAIRYARLAEEVGFDLVGIGDSQSVFREAYSVLSVLAERTERVRLGTTVTNPATRHLAVTASSIATVDEISAGRAFLGIGSGDSAVLNLGLEPVRLRGMREVIRVLRSLLDGRHVDTDGTSIHAQWIPRPVPLYISAEGPKTLEFAGEVADGVIAGMGVAPSLVERTLEHIAAGAARSGRTLEDLDIWVLTRVNVATGHSRLDLVREIRQELASSAHHAFRFTLEGKDVPERFTALVRDIQAGYRPAAHEDLGESDNARLLEDADFLDYMGWRFGVVGEPQECAEQLAAIREAGIHNFLFTGFVDDRAGLIETLGERVLPAVA
jgi:5,10-methylenetetrahydromethanopterin reductase